MTSLTDDERARLRAEIDRERGAARRHRAVAAAMRADADIIERMAAQADEHADRMEVRLQGETDGA
ncbi:hypothetical protein [Hansschlegelia beijingensis]|uniref:RNA 3'-terminal phosphate cyclase n=1 Tax=Hansschlegelia beijingensis TaxID=1133344 RepID=A0A7W6D1N4_9HYPH|nr:hypothetical protein [Hansschlegelia beijingensis]MBB3974407.1 RNA 3'-terminal phosphate cyclase [Hansschlegelia beijingensis]